MQEERPFHSLQHPTTKRWAILEDDGVSAWLYVSEPNVPKPIGDCFVYNCQPPQTKLPESQDRSGPPPIIGKFASSRAALADEFARSLRLSWTRSGNAAAVWLDHEPIAFLEVGQKRGVSRGIGTVGPYGHPWDESRFAELFSDQLG
jgi:hypothetical protein